jgi:hypothetical protein
MQHSYIDTRFLAGAQQRRKAMRTAGRVKVIEWIATFAAVVFIGSLVAALLP